MPIQIVLNGKAIHPDLAEAHMDESCQLLSRSPDGICVVGLASCSALLIKNKSESALWHISVMPTVMQEEEIQSVLIELMTKWPDQTVEVILASSARQYELSIEEDRRNCPTEQDEDYDTVGYLSETNEQNSKILAHIFSEIDKVPGLDSEQITLSCIDIPHGFLVVDSSNQMQLYQEHRDDEIRWEENSADLDSDIESEEEEDEDAQVLASNHNINEARDNERKFKQGNKRTAEDSFFQSNKKPKEAVLQQQQARVSQNVIDEEKDGGFKKHP